MFKGLYVWMSIIAIMSVLLGPALFCSYGSIRLADPWIPGLPIVLPIVCGGLAWLFHKLDEAVHWDWI
jgi:hypothetical protein